MRSDIDPTITIHKFDREVRRVLAGVFETTPMGLFVYLGGKPEDYDSVTEAMMEWHLRSLGYERQEYRPLCWVPAKVAWFRRQRWPEDGPWVRGDLVAILDEVESVCD
jgi:hypothetical protein